MRLGAITLPNAPWPELVERWGRLDELGVQTVWVADHLGNPYRPEQPWHEAWACLAGMAAATRAARIGPLVSPITFRNPAVIARAAVTIDHLSQGRLELGVGAGGSPFDHRLAGVPAWPPSERAVRLSSFVVELARLLSDPSLAPRPLQERIPLTLGGHGPTILRLAAEYADRWNTYAGRRLSPGDAVRIARERNEALSRLCEERGRDPRSLTRSVLVGYGFVKEEPWRSLESFHALVERWGAAGFDEVVVYYPPEVGMPEASVLPGVFEQAVAELRGG